MPRAGEYAISLTHKEYALLEYLVRNAGRVVSRAEIAEHVWDESFDPFSNLIEVYINRLRRKIDPDGQLGIVADAAGRWLHLEVWRGPRLAEGARSRLATPGKANASDRKKHA